MPFITSAIAAIGSAVTAVSGFVAGLGVVGKAVLSLGLSMGLSALAGALGGPKSQAEKPGEISATLQVGGDIPRQVALGRVALRGHLAFVATAGIANERLCQLFILSDGWCDGLDAVWFGEHRHVLEPLPPDQNAVAKYWISQYGDTGFGDKRATIWFYDGRPGQGAPGRPIAFAPDRVHPADRWAGMAYVVVELINNNDTFDAIPDLLWELRGYRCHDPRKDPAFGGAGSHSLGNPATWEFSENPALHAWNYLRGIQAEGQSFMGLDLADYDLLAETFLAAANIADEAVPLETGGSEPRYRASTVLTASEADHRAALAPLVQALAGYLIERNGAFGLLAGAAQLPVVTITDEDVDWTRGVKWSGSRSRTERVNEVHGQFVDPGAQWQANSYPAITSSVYSGEDGERLAVQLDFGAIISPSQAQRAARIRMRETRRQASATATCGFHLLWLEPGDWLRWTSATFKADKLYRLVSRDLNPDDTVTLSLQEVGNEIYSWSSADEQPYLPPATAPGEVPLPSTVTNFAVQPDMLVLENVNRPVIVASWDPIADSRVVAVVIEYRAIGEIAATRLRDDSPADGQFIIDQPPTGRDYEYRATIRTVPARPVTWTPWLPLTSDAVGFPEFPVKLSQFAEGIEPVGLEDGLPNPVGWAGPKTILNMQDGKLYRYVDGAWISTVDAEDIEGTLGNAQIESLAASKITGQLTDSQIQAVAAAKISGTIVENQIANGAITIAKHAAGTRPIEIVGTLPVTGNVVGRAVMLTSDNKLYRWTGSAWTSAVAAVDVTGQLTDAQIAAVAAAKVTGQLTSDQIASLQAAKVAGQLTNSQIADIAAAKITGQVVGTQISDNAISTPKLAAGAITTAKLAAGAVTADQIGALAVTAVKLAAGAVEAGKIAAGAVTTEKLSVGSAINLLSNTQFMQGLDTWYHFVSAQTGITFDIRPAGATYAGAAYPTLMVLQANDTATGYVDVRWKKPGVGTPVDFKDFTLPVAPGQRYEASAQCSTHRCAAQIRIEWRDVAGTVINYSAFGEITSNAGSADNPDIWARVVTRGVAPAGAAYAGIHIRKLGTLSGANSYLFIHKPLLGPCPANATEPMPWSEGGTTQIAGGGIVTGAIAAGHIAAGAVVTDKLAAGAITTAKIAAGAVTATEIATNAITSDKVLANAITTAKIAAGAVTANEIAAQAVTATKLFVGDTSNVYPDPAFNDSAFYSSADAFNYSGTSSTGADGRVITIPASASAVEVASGYFAIEPSAEYSMAALAYRATGSAGSSTVQVQFFSTNAAGIPTLLTSSTIVNASANASGSEAARNSLAVIAPATARRARFVFRREAGGDGTIAFGRPLVRRMATGSLIVDGAIAANHITAGAITTAKLAAGAVTANEISASAITAEKIAAGAVETAKIAAGAISADKIAAGAVTAGKIAAGAVVAGSLAANAVTAGTIAAGAVNAGAIAAGVITSTHLAAGAITAGKIAADAISAINITANTITVDKIVTGAIGFGSSSGLPAATNISGSSDTNWYDVHVIGIAPKKLGIVMFLFKYIGFSQSIYTNGTRVNAFRIMRRHPSGSEHVVFGETQFWADHNGAWFTEKDWFFDQTWAGTWYYVLQHRFVSQSGSTGGIGGATNQTAGFQMNWMGIDT